MKQVRLAALALSLACLPVAAQVKVEVELSQQQFIPGQAIPIAVRITNRSGQTLHLGQGPGWLTFSVESREGLVVNQLDNVPVEGEFELETAKTAVKRVNLEPYFSFPRQGRYSVTATVKVKDWDREIASLPAFFNIIEGAKLWEQEFGVPLAKNAKDHTPEIRKYILQQVSYMRGSLRLFLRVTDAAGGKTVRVFPIGPMVSFGRPEPQIDRESNLHVLYQFGPFSYSHTVFNPDGDLVKRETYDINVTRPKLALDNEGKVIVRGGVRKPAENDYPPAEKSETSDDGVAPTAGATSTNQAPGVTTNRPSAGP